MSKLSIEDFYHQFHNHDHHRDSTEADFSIMDTMHPRAFYKSAGKRVNFREMVKHKGQHAPLKHGKNAPRT